MITQHKHNSWFEGSRFLILTTGLLSIMVAALVTFGATPVDGIRLAIRVTARTSLFFFILAFTASAVAQIWPGTLTSWIRRNRRYLGLSFAASHGLHLIVIITLANYAPEVFWTLSNKVSIIAGSSGYFFIFLLAGTSFNRAVQWLGPKLWTQIHLFGLWFIWVSFIFTNGKRVPVSLWYLAPLAILAAAFYIRKKGLRLQGSKTVSTASAAISG